MTIERVGDRPETKAVTERRNNTMSMGYAIEINDTPTEHLCPPCGHGELAPEGLVIVQRPSGDLVCETCAKDELAALFIELCVLRDDTPSDFPQAYRALEAKLSIDDEGDTELSRLLASVALQRDPSEPAPSAVDGAGPSAPST